VIFTLRGTNGSGKSYLIRKLLDSYPHRQVEGGYFIPTLNLYVVGDYEHSSGGCDRIGTTEEVMEAIEKFHSSGGNVIFEGVIVSTVFKTWADFGRERMVWLFLDTPLHVCAERVKKRGGTSHQQKIRHKHSQIRRLANKVKFNGYPHYWIRYNHSLKDLVNVLKRYV